MFTLSGDQAELSFASVLLIYSALYQHDIKKNSNLGKFKTRKQHKQNVRHIKQFSHGWKELAGIYRLLVALITEVESGVVAERESSNYGMGNR